MTGRQLAPAAATATERVFVSKDRSLGRNISSFYYVPKPRCLPVCQPPLKCQPPHHPREWFAVDCTIRHTICTVYLQSGRGGKCARVVAFLYPMRTGETGLLAASPYLAEVLSIRRRIGSLQGSNAFRPTFAHPSLWTPEMPQLKARTLSCSDHRSRRSIRLSSVSALSWRAAVPGQSLPRCRAL